MRSLMASNAYRKSSSHRSLREQEAEVFFRVNAGLRRAKPAPSIELVRALADNERLWIAVADLMRDAENKLPNDIRALILSVGHSVRREMAAPAPDIGFLVGVNENVAAGLLGAMEATAGQQTAS